ncbi:hypothetical protein JCM10449v2_007496 [Rhodotorula kratochvilovae]
MAGLRAPSPAPAASTSTSPWLDPPSLRSASRSRATTGLSNLTTRSSSTSRIYSPEATYAPLLSPMWPGAASSAARRDEDGVPGGRTDAYRSSKGDAAGRAPRSNGQRSSCDPAGEAAQLEKENRAGVVGGRRSAKGKEKAVAFVVGISSSGDEGDVELESDDEEAGPRQGDLGSAVFEGDTLVPREPSVEELIRAQDLDILLPLGIADYTFVRSTSRRSSALDITSTARAHPAESPEHNGADPPDPCADRITLGKGKFSEVLLVRKGGAEYALKHTPLHPHHQLISNRLLREPTILAQLLPHRNLVKVFETVRTPGHFYLVEENLRSSVTLEDLVSSWPGGVLPVAQAWSVLEQLSSVVRSLHEPLRVCHRDIKPENILIRITPSPPSGAADTGPTLHLKLLDFGLATHFSGSEAKLTTCCGSPAYHSPELWRGLRDKFGSVRYHGPEIDVWCVGLTVLRCVTPSKYPLGFAHTSLQSLADKVVDALLAVPDPQIRQVLAGFLHLDGTKRMRAFDRFCASLPERLARRAEGEGRQIKEDARPLREKKEFKTTSFVPAPLAHRLELFLDEESYARSEGPKLEATIVDDSLNDLVEHVASSATSTVPPRISRSTSSARTATLDEPQVPTTTVLATGIARAASDSPPSPACDRQGTPELSPLSPDSPTLTISNPSTDSLTSASSAAPTSSLRSLPFRHPSYPPPIELTLLNPTNEPIRRAVSYVKYALRCKGILYHVREDSPFSHLSSSSSLSAATPTSSTSFTSPDSATPSLPPTPFAQPFTPLAPRGTFPFPSSPTPDESYTCYLHCVVALPPSSSPSASPLSPATSRLRATLERTYPHPQQRRPGMPPRANTYAGYGGAERTRSASTPPLRASDVARGKKGAQPPRAEEKEKVEALTFFLSIRKPGAADSPSRQRSRSRRARGVKAEGDDGARNAAYEARIVLTLSDDRALPFVRDALALPNDGGDGGTDSAESEAERRGRVQRGQAVTSPRAGQAQGAHSGSRDARARRREVMRRAEEDEDVAKGLGMAMGPPAHAEGEKSGSGGMWDFGLGGLVDRLVRGGGSRASSRDGRGREDETGKEDRTRARSSLGL